MDTPKNGHHRTVDVDPAVIRLLGALRHSFASIAITNGADIASVSEKLGHSDKAVTLRMYTHSDPDNMRKASEIFRNALRSSKEKDAGRGNTDGVAGQSV